MSADNVTPIRPGITGTPQVTNPKTRGRPRGTTSLRVERRRREAQLERERDEQYHPSVKVGPPERGRFHYPKEFLLQKCICKNSHGWMLPSLWSFVFANRRQGKSDSAFVSPLHQLLSQLDAEGHDVAGARLEFEAMREIITGYHDAAQKLSVMHAPNTREVIENAAWNIDFDGYRPSE